MNHGRRWLGGVVPLALVLAACGGGGSDSVDTTTLATTAAATTAAPSTTVEPTTTTEPAPTEVTIQPLFVRGDSGGVGEELVSIEPGGDTLRLDFSENEVGGFGDQSRAASWSAVTVATLLTGAPLAGTYRFAIDGRIDGPSAGALKTVAVLSLMQGATLADDITMTGTINPDGTVGPVGGIPEKIKGAADAGVARVLIPAGQRNATDSAGATVDVVDAGRRLGVDVQEVVDVYEAYAAFTGEELPRLPSSSDTKLSSTSYDRLEAKANEFLAKFQESAGAFTALDPAVQENLGELATLASDAATRADNLRGQGLQAGAFGKATEAAAYADAAVAAGQLLQIYLTQGIDPFLARVSQSQAIEGQVSALLDLLKTFSPTTVGDASALMYAYAGAIDALSVSIFASNQIEAIAEAIQTGQIAVEDGLSQLLLPAIYYEIAGTQVDVVKSVFEVSRDLGGPAIQDDIDLATTADFFRKASDANFEAFKTNIVKEYANAYGVSEDIMLNRFANADIEIALSANQQNVIGGLSAYIGEGEPNAEFAQLGYGVSNYARNALLVEKYYANGQTDEELNLVGVRSDQALIGGLDLGKSQLSSVIGQMREQGIEPAIQAAQYEAAAVDREGDVSEKFDALNGYWSGYLSGRVLAYLGGFETDGLT